MLNKRIKAIILACVLVCAIPMASNAMDKEDFLKFLINTSYPETKTEENKEKNSEASKETGENINKEESDYIKVHIGEENIPPIANENSNSGSNVESGDADKNTANIVSGYNNNIKVTSDKPRILLYHTHSCETYSNNADGNYHSQDMENSVMAVGQSLTTELASKGLGVVHTTSYHDYPSYNASYSNSSETINKLLPKYPSIDITIDLHREGKDLPNEKIKKEQEAKYTTTINGEKVAKFFFVVGEKNPNVEHVNKLANDLTKIAEEKYPGLVLPVIKKPYGKFNQYKAKNGLLIEIGSNATSVEEAKATTKYVADVLATYFSQNQ